VLRVRVVRTVARLIAWVFVAAIGYHALLAAGDAARAAHDGQWARSAGFATIALGAGALVVGAVLYARAVRAAGSAPGS
jgi:hypothetical protein